MQREHRVRTNERGCQNATVGMRRGLGKEIVGKGSVKIGWCQITNHQKRHMMTKKEIHQRKNKKKQAKQEVREFVQHITCFCLKHISG